MKKLKTFAQRAKEIEKKFEGRNDKVSLRTKKALMQQLRDEQEEVKAKLDAARVDTPSLDDYSDTNQANLGALLKPAGVTPLTTTGPSAALPDIGGATEAAGGAGKLLGGIGKGVGIAGDLLSVGQDIFGKSQVDDSGATRPDVAAMEKANTTSAITGGVDAIGKFASGDILGGAMGAIKTVGGLFKGNKDLKAANEALANNDQMLANNARPNSYMAAEGGKLPNPTDPPRRHKFELMPKEGSENYDSHLISWGKRMGLNADQLQGFVDQKASDNKWRADRDAFYSDQFSIWRAGKTGVSPNDKLSQTDPVYQKFWKDTKSAWSKDNPRPINDIVMDYQKNGPSGNYRSVDFKYGGKVNKYSGLDGLSLIDKEKTPNVFGKIDLGRFRSVGGDDYSVKTPNFSNAFQKAGATSQTPITDKFMENTDKMISKIGQPTFGDKLKQGTKWLGENAGSIAQYAPAIGALTNKIERGTTPRGTRIQGEPVLGRQDERRIIKEIRGSNNVAGSAKEGSGGSLTAYNALALKGKLNESKAVGEGMQKMADSNLNQELRESQMGERRKFANMQADERFLEREAADEGAYQTAKQQNRAAIFENIGNVGREEVDKKTVKEMYGYKWNGKYWTDPKGKRVSDAEYQNTLKQIQNMFGGYLKK